MFFLASAPYVKQLLGQTFKVFFQSSTVPKIRMDPAQLNSAQTGPVLVRLTETVIFLKQKVNSKHMNM